MTEVIRLIGRLKGQRASVPYHVAQMNVASMGGNGNMCLPDELAEIRVEGLNIEVEDATPEAEPAAPAEPETVAKAPKARKTKPKADIAVLDD